MGEFRVEDTYPLLTSADEKVSNETLKKDEASEGARKTNGERRGGRTQKTHGQRLQQQYRSTQQYYQPRPQNEVISLCFYFSQIIFTILEGFSSVLVFFRMGQEDV